LDRKATEEIGQKRQQQSEEFRATSMAVQDKYRTAHAEWAEKQKQAHAEWAEKQKQADALQKQQVADFKTRMSGRPSKEVDTYYTAGATEAGAPIGKEEIQHVYDALGTDKDNIDTIIKSKDDQKDIGAAMRAAFTYSKDTPPEEVDRVVGALATGNYKTYDVGQEITQFGPTRKELFVTMKNGSQYSITIPNQDLANVLRINKASQPKAEEAPKETPRPAAVSPIPGAQPGAATQGGFNVPPSTVTPSQKWWLGRATGRGEGAGPAFGIPTEQDNRGFNR
jgi:hypothetical protein